MATFNLTFSDSTTFTLIGIPGLEAAHMWISIPFFVCYIISLLGNFTVLALVGKDQTLHKPMYLLLSMLALTDISTSTCVVPKALCIFWFNLKDITLGGCLTQMFFLNTVLVTQSAVLVAMAFDRYVAICNPLRYTTILSNARVAKLGLVCFIRAVFFILPMPLLLSRLPFCSGHIILHTYCDSIAVMKLSCGDTALDRTHSLVLLILITGLDQSLIALSYILIIRAVLRLSSTKALCKALNTCTAHLCVMLLYWTPSFFSNVSQRFAQNIAPHVNIILANVYLLVPSMLNPIIYGFQTKELRGKIWKCVCRK
nr:putative olfactory receptor 52P1 [Pelodiscus sinensis]|eukprot:XP_025038910.1 putative olfactory receptor 52P1 [Pelodiscus sinensis]